MKADEKRDKYYDPFPVNLRGLMNDRHVTQQTLAEAIKVKRQTISAYSDGSADPTLPRLCAMADFFGISIDNLTGRHECTTPENEEIRKLTGLSDSAINALKEMNQPNEEVDEVLKLNDEPVINVVNTLLSTDKGRRALRHLASYLSGDFSRPFIEAHDGSAYDDDPQVVYPPRLFAKSSFSSLPILIRKETLEESALAVAVNELRTLKQEVKNHVNPQD